MKGLTANSDYKAKKNIHNIIWRITQIFLSIHYIISILPIRILKVRKENEFPQLVKDELWLEPSLISPNAISLSLDYEIYPPFHRSVYTVQIDTINICGVNEWVEWLHTASSWNHYEMYLNISYNKLRCQILLWSLVRQSRLVLCVSLTALSRTRGHQEGVHNRATSETKAWWIPASWCCLVGPNFCWRMGSNNSMWRLISRYQQVLIELVNSWS